MGGMGWDGEIDEDEGIDPVRFDLIDMTDCSKSELDGAKKEARTGWKGGQEYVALSNTTGLAKPQHL